MLCFHDYAETVVAHFAHQIQSKYYGVWCTRLWGQIGRASCSASVNSILLQKNIYIYIYTRKELMMMETTISNFRTSFFIAVIQKLRFTFLVYKYWVQITVMPLVELRLNVIYYLYEFYAITCYPESKYSISVFPKKTFSMLHLSPFSFSLFRFDYNFCTWYVQSPLLYTKTSSMYAQINSNPWNKSFILCCKMSGELETPIGRCL